MFGDNSKETALENTHTDWETQTKMQGVHTQTQDPHIVAGGIHRNGVHIHRHGVQIDAGGIHRHGTYT